MAAYVISRCEDASCAAKITRLTHNAFADLAIDPPSSVLKETQADFARRLTTQTALIAETDGEIIASVFCEPKDGAVYFGRLAVRPDWRRRGVASAMMEAVIAEARRRGAPAVTLNARITLPGNLALFRKHGFAVTAQHTHAGYPAPTYVEMELRLTK